MPRQLQQGTGWRVGWDPSGTPFQALLGGDTWAIELNQAEFADFKYLLTQLLAALDHSSHELMDAETITCDASSDLLWMQVHGYPHAFSLNFILLSGRRAEGGWPETVTSEVIRAIQTNAGF